MSSIYTISRAITSLQPFFALLLTRLYLHVYSGSHSAACRQTMYVSLVKCEGYQALPKPKTTQHVQDWKTSYGHMPWNVLPIWSSLFGGTTRLQDEGSNGTVGLEKQKSPVHGSFNVLLYRKPVCSPLCKLIDFLGPKDTVITVRISDNFSYLLGVFGRNQVNLGHFSQTIEILGEVFVTDCSDICVVMICITAFKSAFVVAINPV
jgi:hypothetical protein